MKHRKLLESRRLRVVQTLLGDEATIDQLPNAREVDRQFDDFCHEAGTLALKAIAIGGPIRTDIIGVERLIKDMRGQLEAVLSERSTSGAGNNVEQITAEGVNTGPRDNNPQAIGRATRIFEIDDSAETDEDSAETALVDGAECIDDAEESDDPFTDPSLPTLRHDSCTTVDGETLLTPAVENPERPLGQPDKASGPETEIPGADGIGPAQEDSEELPAFGSLSNTHSDSAIADQPPTEQGSADDHVVDSPFRSTPASIPDDFIQLFELSRGERALRIRGLENGGRVETESTESGDDGTENGGRVETQRAESGDDETEVLPSSPSATTTTTGGSCRSSISSTTRYPFLSPAKSSPSEVLLRRSLSAPTSPAISRPVPIVPVVRAKSTSNLLQLRSRPKPKYLPRPIKTYLRPINPPPRPPKPQPVEEAVEESVDPAEPFDWSRLDTASIEEMVIRRPLRPQTWPGVSDFTTELERRKSEGQTTRVRLAEAIARKGKKVDRKGKTVDRKGKAVDRTEPSLNVDRAGDSADNEGASMDRKGNPADRHGKAFDRVVDEEQRIAQYALSLPIRPVQVYSFPKPDEDAPTSSNDPGPKKHKRPRRKNKGKGKAKETAQPIFREPRRQPEIIPIDSTVTIRPQSANRVVGLEALAILRQPTLSSTGNDAPTPPDTDTADASVTAEPGVTADPSATPARPESTNPYIGLQARAMLRQPMPLPMSRYRRRQAFLASNQRLESISEMREPLESERMHARGHADSAEGAEARQSGSQYGSIEDRGEGLTWGAVFSGMCSWVSWATGGERRETGNVVDHRRT